MSGFVGSYLLPKEACAPIIGQPGTGSYSTNGGCGRPFLRIKSSQVVLGYATSRRIVMRFSSTNLLFSGTARLLTLFMLALAGLVTAASAQTPTVVYTFNTHTADVINPLPYGLITQGRDGNLYSSTKFSQDANDNGGVFLVSPSGTESVSYKFLPTDGTSCNAGVDLGSDGNFYGVCFSGGPGSQGIVYKVTPTGTFTILHSFTGTSGDGAGPFAPPIQAADGNFYGTTNTGGAHNDGTVYKLTPGGTLTILYSFTAGTDGFNPYAPLVQGTDGNLYGSTFSGGAHNFGTTYKISTAGKLTTLHAFNNTDGFNPIGGMIQGSDGNFYGTTYTGGANNNGVVFKMTAGGTLTVLHSFLAATDGQGPQVALMQATDGNFYGINVFGGHGGGIGGMGLGSIFKVTAKGVFSTVYLFDSAAVGGNPGAALVQNTNGLLYGDSFSGPGGGGYGAFYSLNIGAAPFLRLALTSGKAGDQIGMFGQGFSSSSVVKFGGVAATSITLTGSTYIVATVPAGALTGKVTVATGSTTLTSTQSFTVHDSWTSGAVMPAALAGPATGVIGSKVYIEGGGNAGGVLNLNQIYNATTNKWTTGAAMPTARSTAVGAVVSGLVYVIGGATGGSTETNVVEAYNPTTNTWSTKAAMPTARKDASVVVQSGIIYVIGGYKTGIGALSTVESYNPATNTWSTKTSLLVAKYGSAAGLLGSTIVAAGGGNSGVTGDNEGYSASKNTWGTLVADPTARAFGCSAAISGQLYFGGGTSDFVNGLSLLESFNATTKKWTTLAPMPQPAFVHGSATAGNLLYCFGGTNNMSTTFYNNVQIYRP
jgi:uncharacterized repeat protein (TIGR03803 family)